MTDPDLIQSAYEDAIKRLYATLFDAYVDGEGPCIELELRVRAEERFKAGLSLARAARDRAIRIVRQPT